MKIRAYEPTDLAEWVRMRSLLWPEIVAEGGDPVADAAQWTARMDACVIVAERPGESALAGFAEVGERAYADGCSTEPVAYLEGWYVDADVRGRGIGAALVKAAEKWAQGRGYREFASDALLENVDSQQAHEAVGFVEVERAVRYRKLLTS